MLDGEMVRWCHHNIPMPLKLGIVAALPSPPPFLLSLYGKYFLNPFNAVNDQERISPYNISTISSSGCPPPPLPPFFFLFMENTFLTLLTPLMTRREFLLAISVQYQADKS